jgi:ribosomal protein S18 acetylase RimI-like enzyme
MDQAAAAATITIRPAVSEDADGIARVYLESAEHHASLDSRYWIPDAEVLRARYREGRQHPPETAGKAITLVAEIGGEIAGFVDAWLERSTDPLQRDILYCIINELAVSSRLRSQGTGGQLLQAAEDWGRQRGAELAALSHLANNTRAAAFYQRMGYAVTAIREIKRL